MKKQIAISVAIASLFGASTVALAQADQKQDNKNANGSQSDNTMLFGMLDTNDDGKLTEEELSNMPEAVAKLAYRQMDLDGNGKISQLEFTTASQAQALRAFGMLDTNGDGVLDTSESSSEQAKQRAQSSNARTAYYKKLTQKMDTDSNGKVSRAEWLQAFMPDMDEQDAKSKTTDKPQTQDKKKS